MQPPASFIANVRHRKMNQKIALAYLDTDIVDIVMVGVTMTEGDSITILLMVPCLCLWTWEREFLWYYGEYVCFL